MYSLAQVLDRIRAFQSSPPPTPRERSAALRTLRHMVRRGIAWQQWRPLFDALGGDASRIGERPILLLIWELIETRPEGDREVA